MAKHEKVVVAQHEDKTKEVPRNVLAGAIVDISSALKRLTASGLTFEAVVILTYHNCKSTGTYGNSRVGMGDVRAVLGSLKELEQRFCR